MNGGGGIRTLVCFRTHRFRGGPVRPSPAPLLPSTPNAHDESAEAVGNNRGARIRTGDLSDPNGALYRAEPHPVPNDLGHCTGIPSARRRRNSISASERSIPRRVYPGEAGCFRSTSLHGGSIPHAPKENGRGGIRTHAGFRPHDFQSCALSRSATRPERHQAGSNECLAEAEGVGFEPTRAFRPNALAGRRF